MPLLVHFLLIFTGVGVFFLFIHLLMGKFIRPSRPETEKLTIYECGEPTVGSAWIQFDVRYYVVALLFVIFDVEVAFFFPWAVVFGSANQLARTERLASADSDRQQLIEARRQQKLIEARLATGLPALKRVAAGQPIEEEPKKEQTTQELAEEIAGVAANAKSWAWLAFVDIVVFFGVLMVGFAYLWRRGDIDWVRSTLSERAAPETLEESPRLVLEKSTSAHG